ncbi:uncharacterized protein BDZ99DRAFT_31308 [Mytilinidion resinicola]|uniref:GPI anchored serine-threonine rich protein n=1 Tax=Mytilinidion resinicola TaxID=574789 RepID=A0A6A6YL96_9PEZI|nr:uncharacterized protein BDZ99DRAFT_31308 [Mytilinidion resinicola]KAF2809561.1 hypothetical protein BDZ99DRAFT_31308 [Mytilinidion resinicola]
MRFIATLAVLASAGFAAAQTQSSLVIPKPTSGTCAAQNIVDACVSSIQPQITACSGTDWICLCQQYTNLLTCYNNCPGSSEGQTVQNQVTSYCTAAAPYISASLSAAATMPHWSFSATAAATEKSVTTGTASKASGTAAAASATSTGVAGFVGAPIGGVLAVVLGLAGLL